MWPEIRIVDGDKDKFLRSRTACMIGEGLPKKFGFKVGDTVPIIGTIFGKPGGEAWEFTVEAIYVPDRPTLDNSTLFFGWDYFAETFKEISGGEEPDVGVIVIESEPGRDVAEVIAAVDQMFAGGPQRVQTTTEAEFSRLFVSMIGNVPRLLSFIGGGVLIAILLACVNTMLMAGREQTHDIGILKALGFNDAVMFRMMVAQSLVLCLLGGTLGIAMAAASAPAIAPFIQQFFPNYTVQPDTMLLAAGVTVAIGLFAGFVPAWTAARLRCVDALRAQA
jgi:putative ABC transport system permease protein